MLHLLVIILHDMEKFEDLMAGLKRAGAPGVTILPSIGGYEAQQMLDSGGLSQLMRVFRSDKPHQRMLLCLIDDQKLLAKVVAEADKVVQGFDRPSSGILFTIPVADALGLQKWGIQTDAVPDLKPGSEDFDEGSENLVMWLEEELRNHFSKSELKKMAQLPKKQISEFLDQVKLYPAVVKMDSTMPEIARAMKAHPEVHIACVVNSEDRLMGVVDMMRLANALMPNFVPQEYVSNPEEYETVLKFLERKELVRAGDLIRDPISIQKNETLAEALHIMRKNNLKGIVVVDEQYQLIGYVSLLELMLVCIERLED